MSKVSDVDSKKIVDGDKLHVNYSQDVTPTLESVRQARDLDGGVKEEGRFVARVPQSLFMQWGLEDAGDMLAYLQGRHNQDPELAAKLAMRLNSNEFNMFRVWEGRIATSDIIKEGNKFASLNKED